MTSAQPKYQAVVFDLFGTLINYLPLEEWNKTHRAVASVLSVSADELMQTWRSLRPERDRGAFGGLEGDIQHACITIGVSATPAQIAAAMQIRLEIFRRNLKLPAAGAVETLRELRSMGLRVGLITDCADEVPMVWESTCFAGLMDSLVFSSRAGTTKPDPAIYQMACEQLAVSPEKCLYVGDGGSHELTGAAQVGMTPVLIRTSYDENYDAYQPDAVGWTGLAISRLENVFQLLDVTRGDRNG